MHQIDPLRDSRWRDFIQNHPRSSVFHTPGWLEALRRTYGYEPVTFTTTAHGQELRNGIVFCRVESWITGRRLVSLPFSDHCEPLVDSPSEFLAILSSLRHALGASGWKYIEFRPLSQQLADAETLTACSKYYLHKLNLRRSADQLFGSFHKDSVQRKIRRAEREKLHCEEGRSEALLKAFYTLTVKTRRRHCLPPQPMAWFHNLVRCLGEALNLRVAFKDSTPIASIMTLLHGKTLVYKYGCSDERFSNLGGTALLFWEAIREATERGFNEFDLGRSDMDASGLVRFKKQWGSNQSTLTYWRWPAQSVAGTAVGLSMNIARKVIPYLPDRILTSAGGLLYRHLG